MLPDTQPEFELPAILRLPQVPPLKVPARRQTQFMARPAPVRHTEPVPVTPPLAPETDLFIPVPVTPPMSQQPQTWIRTPNPANRGGIRASILPGEKSDACRDANHRVRPGSALARSGRDESRPYRRPQGWISDAVHMSVGGYIPTGRRSREIGNGELLLGCAFLILMGLLALGLVTWLSTVR